MCACVNKHASGFCDDDVPAHARGVIMISLLPMALVKADVENRLKKREALPRIQPGFELGTL